MFFGGNAFSLHWSFASSVLGKCAALSVCLPLPSGADALLSGQVSDFVNAEFLVVLVFGHARI
jgi:hypothetical protein